MLTPCSCNSALSRISVFGKNYNNDFFWIRFSNDIIKYHITIKGWYGIFSSAQDFWKYFLRDADIVDMDN